MDIIQGRPSSRSPSGSLITDIYADWAAHLMGNHEALQAYGPYARQFYSAVTIAKSYVLSLVDQVSRKPDLATIALLLVIVFVSLKILNMLWETLMFWIRLARKIVVWGGLLAFALWMYNRGPEGVMEDVNYWWQVWNQDYDYWKERERVARMARQGYTMRDTKRGGSWF